MSLKTLLDLGGKVALVTGGSRGLGFQMAEALGELGARVALTARKAHELEAAVTRLAAQGVEALAIPVDLGRRESIPAVVDAVVRLVPGVITGESLEEESFSGGLLEYPHYTRPEEFRGMRVPEVLLSGHHEKIRQWRLLRSVEKTLKYRPELLASDRLPPEVKDLAGQLRREGDSYGHDQGA